MTSKNMERAQKTPWFRLHGDPSHQFNGFDFKEKELASFDPNKPETSKFKRGVLNWYQEKILEL